jgi:DNA helicase-2/ATP-dependent DNA helicase PcrA
MNHLSSLNEEQRLAVEETDGPVLIVAGAGAGKTKTLTSRILHLIEKGVRPENILAITFTNKAAKEMRERVLGLLKQNNLSTRSVPFVSTFHALGVQIIKENSELLGLPRHFNIFDTDDSKKILKDLIKEIGIEPKEHLDKVRNIISREKGKGVSAQEYTERQSYDFSSELVKKIWPKYESRLKKEAALDFDDLLLKTLKLLQKFPDILEKYQERFKFIHIDEYQDTNGVQNSIVELLADKYKNICVVGDTDQNIYSWRGAEIKNMLHFEKTYPRVKTFFLEQNYRSTKNILFVANKIIEKNNYRIPKKLFTENIEGEKVSVFEARSEVDESHFIAIKSKELIESGVKPEEIAVLYRANFQSRVLEEAFLSYGLPYQMIGTKFFERKEIKDIISYIKASLSEENLSDFLRIVNVPPRGIGKTTTDKIFQDKLHELNESTKIKISNFKNMLSSFKKVLVEQKISEAIKHIIKKSGMEELYSTGKEEDTERLENIMELVTLAREYDELNGEEALDKFLTDVALISDQDSMKNESGGVRLMTVHASKGLEFDTVFVCGLEEDLFPHKKLSEGKSKGEESEEERRLFYVAITRAGKKLFLTWSRVRTIFGSPQINSPSEFLLDVPSEYIENESYSSEPNRKVLYSIDF